MNAHLLPLRIRFQPYFVQHSSLLNMEAPITYEFSASVWRHPSPAGWYFVSLPAGMSTEIRNHLKWQEEGWGRIKARAKVGTSSWQTAIWFDTKRGTYLLPIRSDIRKKECIGIGSELRVQVLI